MEEWTYDRFMDELRYLKIEDVGKLCQQNRKFREYCSFEETWNFLLNRDYPGVFVETSESSKEVYMKFYNQDKLLYPLVTEPLFSDLNCMDADEALLILTYIKNGIFTIQTPRKFKGFDEETVDKFFAIQIKKLLRRDWGNLVAAANTFLRIILQKFESKTLAAKRRIYYFSLLTKDRKCEILDQLLYLPDYDELN